MGLKSDQWILLKKMIQSVLKQGQVVDVWIFGSRARNKFRKYSDVDLLFCSKSGESFSPSQQIQLQNLLEESTLPYKFDLVIEESIFEPYREGIMAERKLLFDALTS